MRNQSHKMTVSIDEHTSHLEPLKAFYEELDKEGVTIEKLTDDRREQYQLQAINLTLEHVWNRNAHYRAALEAAA